MKYKTAFRLALRAIGVLLFFMNLPNLFRFASWIASAPLADPSLEGLDLRGRVVWFLDIVADLAGTLGGLYLFFGGAWIVNRAIPSNKPYCPECGYDLTGGTESARCPECGLDLRQPTPLDKHEA